MVDVKPDKYQQEVIDSTAKDCVVLAGAGSGKTFTLISKIKKLVEQHKIVPDCILVLTFTRVAAANMRDKYLNSCNLSHERIPDFNTFHALCYKVLKEYPETLEALGYTSLPQVVNEVELNRLKLEAKHAVSCKISDSKINNPSKLKGKDKFEYEKFKRAFDHVLNKTNCVTFDTLSEQVCGLFQKDDPSIQKVKSQYKYLFVDEFQDTDEVQFNFVQSMSHCKRVLCGDPLQNIYQFRGCSNRPLKQLTEDHNWVCYKLPINYRSSNEICEYVNKESRKFKSSKYSVDLRGTFNGPDVHTVDSSNRNNESVLFHVQQLIPYGTVSVLCRSNYEVRTIQDLLGQKGIQCQNSSSVNYFTNLIKSCQDVDFMISWITSDMSDDNFLRYQRTLSSFSSEVSCIRSIEKKPRAMLEEVEQVKDLAEIATEQSTYTLCKLFNVDTPPYPLSSSTEIYMYLLNRINKESSQLVTVGTIHSVKGLEFDSVVVSNVNSKAFKLDTEECQNLFYVACTRAKKNLVVVSSDF